MKAKIRFNALLGVFLILLCLFLIYQLLLKIFGGSFTVSELAGGLLLGIVGYCFRISNKVSKVEGKFEQFGKRFDSQTEELKELNRTNTMLSDKFRRFEKKLEMLITEVKGLKSHSS